MITFEKIGTHLVAAVASIAVTAILLAVAIAPANQGMILPGALA
jgi:hypothetical protein